MERVLNKIFKDFTWVDFVLYALIFFMFYKALKMELADIYCPSQSCSKELCGEGKGAHYYNTEPAPGDSVDVLLTKIVKCAQLNRKTVYWRRSLMITLIATTILWLVLFERILRGYEAITAIFIIGGLWYYSFSFFNYHHFDHAKNNILKLCNAIKNNK